MRSVRSKPKNKISHIVGTVFSVGLFFYFGYHLVHGDQGYFALRGLEKKLVTAERKYEEKKLAREALENRVRLLRPDSLDLDLLDERARVVLGHVKADERVIIQRN